MAKYIKKTAVLLLLLVLAAAITLNAWAAPAINVGARCSFSVEGPYSDVEFSLYRVAEVSAGVDYTAVGAFNIYLMSFEHESQQSWQSLAATLKSYVLRDNVAPTATATTDSEGGFTVSDLHTGLYLVMAKPFTKNGATVSPAPSIVALPMLDSNDQWLYDYTVIPKYPAPQKPVTPPSGGNPVVSISAGIVWQNDSEDKRPESVELLLLKNGEPYDSVVLTKDNWTHTWDNLEADAQWTVVEGKTPEGYTALIETDGQLTTITFTFVEVTPPDIKPEPRPEGTELPGDGTSSLWGILIIFVGLILFIIGWRVRRKGE